MLGKASEIKISESLKNADGVRLWLYNHPECLVVEIKVSPYEENDYFHIIYKEGESNDR